MSKEAYIVMGATGAYSDVLEWPVIVYLERTDADKHAAVAQREANAIEKECANQHDSPARPNPYDRHMKMDYTGTSYNVLVVPLGHSQGGEP